MIDWKKVAIFAGGTLLGSAGFKLLASQDARKAYTHATAALRCKDSVMTTVTQVQEATGDILADAKEINETRAPPPGPIKSVAIACPGWPVPCPTAPADRTASP